MGEFYVANSPNFAYKIHIWFRILREDMMKISGHKEGMQKSVNQAIECAQWWVTMGIFGIISIHFPPIGVNCAKLEKILEHAWEIIQAIFDQWRHMQVKDMKVQVCSRVVEEGHLLDPLHLFRYFVKLNDLTKIKSQILTSIILQYNKGSKTLKIDIDTVGKLYNKVQSLYNKDQMFIHGGFYSRARVGNLEYEAINSFSGPKKSTLGSKSLSRRVAECRLISQSAQFLSPVGINLCQKMSNCQSRIRYDSE
ncbi:hypothetical protein DFH28DRAFT_972736 [Melampsora americana]|nr:hypothetical protein DFH28DRAFT_972736 [Melampsora americana]